MQRDQARRAMRGAADGVDRREVLVEQVFAADHFDARAVRFGEFAAGLFELVRAHVFGGRVDQVAHAHAGGHDVERFGIDRSRDQPRRRTQRHLVARELVSAQAPAEVQRALRVFIEFRRQRPIARRQREGRVRIGERIQRIADAEHRARDAAIARQQQHAARDGAERMRVDPAPQFGHLQLPPCIEARAFDAIQRQTFRPLRRESVRIGHATSSWRCASSQSASASRVGKRGRGARGHV